MQLASRTTLEAEFLEKLAGLSEAKRDEFLRAAGDPPVPERVPSAWWAAYREEVAALLLLLLARGWVDSAVQHGMDPDRAAASAAGWSAAQSRRLAGEYIENSRAGILGQANRLRSDDLLTTESLVEVSDVAFGRGRLEGLVTTETTRSTVRGGENAIRGFGAISALDVWKVNPGKSKSGPCGVCQPLSGSRRAEWGLVFPDGPPAHPGCVCEIIYEVLNGG